MKPSDNSWLANSVPHQDLWVQRPPRTSKQNVSNDEEVLAQILKLQPLFQLDMMKVLGLINLLLHPQDVASSKMGLCLCHDSRVYVQKEMLRESDSATWSISHHIKITRNPQIAVVSQRCWDFPLRDFYPLTWAQHYRVPAHYLGFVDLIQTFDSCELPHSLLSGPNHHPLHHWHPLSLTSGCCPVLTGFQVALTVISTQFSWLLHHVPGTREPWETLWSQRFPQILSLEAEKARWARL